MIDDGHPMAGQPTGLTCDTCEKPILHGEAIYGIAYNEEKRTSRHWDCNVPLEDILEQMRDVIDRAESLARDLDRRKR